MRTPSKLLCLFFVMTSISLSQGSLLLVGGGGEDYNDWSDVPYRWLVTHAPNGKIIVLNYADTTSWFSGYFPWLSPCSVTNLAIISKAQANDSAVYRRILEHDGIFLRGGDQWQYVSMWRGTLAEQAIRAVYARGGVVGGTSAGAMVLSEVIFDAQLSSVAPRAALRNPLGAGITLSDDFLGFGKGLVADSHFYERGRLGRLPAFMALYKQSKGREVTGVGIDYNTALGITSGGAAEVMGAGTVTVLRYSPGTTATLAAGEALNMTELLFDQLTAGGTISFASGAVQSPTYGFPYDAAAFASRASTVICDGSNNSVDWSAADGSLKKLQGALAEATDTVGVIASASSAVAANAVSTTLTSWGVATRLLRVSDAANDNRTFSSALLSCRAFVFAGNPADSLVHALDTMTLSGAAFAARVNAGAPLLFLSDDVLLAGDQGVGQLYKSIYGAYYGYLTPVDGIGVVHGLQCVPRVYENSDYIDNRASALFWNMARLQLPFGLLLDAGAYVVITGGQMKVFGTTPVMLIDARGAQWGSLPQFRDPGKLTPRQNGGITGARYHVLRGGSTFDAGPTTSVSVGVHAGPLPDRPHLGQNYPNPFNPSTTIGYTVVNGQSTIVNRDAGSAWVRLAVYDILGREVAVLVDGLRGPGEYTVTFDGRALAGGVYFYRLITGTTVETKRLLLLR